MIRSAAIAPLLLVVAACTSPTPSTAPAGDAPASEAPSALEKAAIRSGLVGDGAAVSPEGAYQNHHEGGRDGLCLLRRDAGGYSFGMQAVFGDETACRGHGTARLVNGKLIMNFARSSCIMVSDYEGDRISLPGTVDVSCNDLCGGNGSFEGVSFPRVSDSAQSARALRDRDDAPLCE